MNAHTNTHVHAHTHAHSCLLVYHHHPHPPPKTQQWMEELLCQFPGLLVLERGPQALRPTSTLDNSQELCVRAHKTKLNWAGPMLSVNCYRIWNCGHGGCREAAFHAQPESSCQIFLDKVRELCQMLLSAFPEQSSLRALLTAHQTCIKVLRHCQQKVILPLGFYLDAFQHTMLAFQS